MQMSPPVWLLVLGGLAPPVLLACVWLGMRLARTRRIPPGPQIPPPPPVPIIPSVIRVHLVDERPPPAQEVQFAPRVRENDPDAETRPLPKFRPSEPGRTIATQRGDDMDKAIEHERTKLRRR